MLNFKLKRNFIVALLTSGSIFSTPVNAAIDPFNTDHLPVPNPQTYWIKPLSLNVTPASSQQTTATLPQKPLTLAEITEFSLINNSATRLAWYQAKAAAANVGIAESAYWPQLDGGVAVQYTASVFSSPHSSATDYGPNFSLNYLLLDLGNRSNTVLSAQYAQMAANLNQNNAIQQVILQVQQAYYQVLGQQALVKANKLSVTKAKTSLDVALALRRNGMATIGDVYQAEGSYAQANLDLQTSQGNYRIAQGQLATTMGLPPNTDIYLVPLTNPPEASEMNQAIAQLLATAKRNRPDLLAAEAKVRQAQATLAATKASILPTLTLSAAAQPAGVFTDTTGTDVTAELTLSVPLFTGFSYTYNVKKAQAEVDVAAATRDQLNRKIESQVWQNYFSLQTAEKNMSTTEILLKSSLQANNQAFGQYKGGVGDILSVLTTQTTLANARVQNIQAKLNWYIALAQLAASVGTLNSSS